MQATIVTLIAESFNWHKKIISFFDVAIKFNSMTKKKNSRL